MSFSQRPPLSSRDDQNITLHGFLKTMMLHILALSDCCRIITWTYRCYLHSDSRLLTIVQSYQFNPHLSREDTVTAILVKSLTVFPSPDFSLCLHLLPPSCLLSNPRTGPDTSSLAESVQKLNILNNLLASADYTGFWSTLRSEDLYADLVAEVTGFEELMRVRIAATVSQAVREVERPILEDWLDLHGDAFDRFVGDVCGWSVDGTTVRVPANKENEAKGAVVRENVKFDRKWHQHFHHVGILVNGLQNSHAWSDELTNNRHNLPMYHKLRYPCCMILLCAAYMFHHGTCAIVYVFC